MQLSACPPTFRKSSVTIPYETQDVVCHTVSISNMNEGVACYAHSIFVSYNFKQKLGLELRHSVLLRTQTNDPRTSANS